MAKCSEKRLNVFEEFLCASIGYCAVLKRTNTSFRGRNILCSNRRVRIVKELLCCEVQQDIACAITRVAEQVE
jgi:hypothetical protein